MSSSGDVTRCRTHEVLGRTEAPKILAPQPDRVMHGAMGTLELNASMRLSTCTNSSLARLPILVSSSRRRVPN